MNIKKILKYFSAAAVHKLDGRLQEDNFAEGGSLWPPRIKYTGVEIRKLSLSVSSLISIFGLTSVWKIVLNQYKLSILALFTFKFLNFQWVNSTELKMISVSKLTKENKIYYNQVRMIGSSISFLIFVGYSEWKWVKIGLICIFWK